MQKIKKLFRKRTKSFLGLKEAASLITLFALLFSTAGIIIPERVGAADTGPTFQADEVYRLDQNDFDYPGSTNKQTVLPIFWFYQGNLYAAIALQFNNSLTEDTIVLETGENCSATTTYSSYATYDTADILSVNGYAKNANEEASHPNSKWEVVRFDGITIEDLIKCFKFYSETDLGTGHHLGEGGTVNITIPEPDKYTLTLVSDPIYGGTATDETDEGPYISGAEVDIKAEANTGYEFINWTATAGSFDDHEDPETTFTMPATNTTVTANFEKDDDQWAVITFVAGDNGSLEGDTYFEVLKGTEWSEITVPNPQPNPGYMFEEWDPVLPGDTDAIHESVTYTAKFETVPPDTYTLTMAVDPVGSGTATDKTGKPSYEENEEVEIKAEAGEGYKFIEWTTTGGSFDDEDSPETTFSMPATNTTVTANFEIKTYTVTFKDYDGAELKEEVVEHGSDATAPEDPEREGYIFTGWNTDFTNVTGDLTVKALYEEKEPEPEMGSITSYKYHDADGDGQWNEDQSVLSGWLIFFLGDEVGGEYTDSEGRVVFDGLEMGDYTICEKLNGDWENTYTEPGIQNGIGGNDVCVSITLHEGNPNQIVRFGNKQLEKEPEPDPEPETETRRSRSGGTIMLPEPEGEVLGEEIVVEEPCGIYLFEYIKYGASNNPTEVIKLQTFLNQHMGTSLPLTGIYDLATMQALNRFQLQYKNEVLKPWVDAGAYCDVNQPTGYVYKTTQRWINLIMCPTLNIPMPDLSAYPKADCAGYWEQVLGEDIVVDEDYIPEDIVDEFEEPEAEDEEGAMPLDTEELMAEEPTGEERELSNIWLVIIIILAAVVIVWLIYKGIKK